jgi:hypothetical protein
VVIDRVEGEDPMADNSESKSVWFRERLFGYGYGPSSWQGWLATAIFLVAAIGTASLGPYVPGFYHLSGTWWLGAIAALLLVETGVYLRIVYTHAGPW